jgi:transcriptional regulator with XRE-family HTH domain
LATGGTARGRLGEEGWFGVDDTRTIGTRIREIRTWRRKSLRVVAGLAGISAGYLSRVERGERALDSRRILFALADALQVAPSELTGQPYPPSDAGESAGHAATQALRAVLRDAEIGELATDETRPIDALERATDAADAASAASDYAALGSLVPGLLDDLHSGLARPECWQEGDRLARNLLLVRALHDAFYLAKDLGHFDLAWSVSGHLERAATELGEPTWGAVAGFVRSHAVVGEKSRQRALQLAERAAELVSPDDGDAGQVYGMCHLSAALHTAAAGKPDAVQAHLDEAADVAEYTGDGQFAGLMFGPNNVGAWQLAVHLELGDAGRAIEHARAVDVNALPSAGRQATFYSDLGLALARLRGREQQAVEAIRRAEQLAPSRVRTRPAVRGVVTELMNRIRRDTTGRELRGLAYRMGIAG